MSAIVSWPQCVNSYCDELSSEQFVIILHMKLHKMGKLELETFTWRKKFWMLLFVKDGINSKQNIT